jgi:D-alanyl-D-alanine carboxypeptidase/D-alanyl-D-alanine-endopeptidase (penicillin-binding protein 4)
MCRENRRVGRLCFRAAAAILAIAAITGLSGVAAATSTPLSRRLTHALVAPQIDNSKRAAVAIDLTTGEIVYKLHQWISLEPASTEKVPVTYAALATFGAGFKIRTDVMGSGGQVGKVWRGNLVLVGHGDPTLSSARLAQLAAAVRAGGIRRVTGSILGDESFFDSKRGVTGWKTSFYYNESPPLSALAADRDVYRGKLAMHPAVAAAAIFKQALIHAGVAVGGGAAQGKAPADAIPLGHVYSAPLWKILRFMDRWSDNFTAELVLKQLGAQQGRATSAGGAAAVMSALAQHNVPLTGVRIVDGSGLSLRDRLTARALAGVLQAAWADPPMRKAFRSILAVAGRDGTMRNRLLSGPAHGNVLAKTGTTNEASALSGYASGRYAFAVISNGFPLASWFAKQAEDRFVTVLAGG